MSSKNRSVVRERMNTVSRKRLYKANGHWAVATTGTVALAAAGTLGAVSTVHADTVAPVESTQQVVSTSQESVDTNVLINTEVAPVVASANTTVNQAVQAAQPQVSVAGGNITSTTPQVVNQGNVEQVSQDANQQAMNISAVGSADGVMNAAIRSGSAATKSMGGSYVVISAKDASLMTPEQIQSFGQSEAAQLSAVGAGNTEQLSAANANGQLISNASGVMAPGKTMDVSKLTPVQIASMTSRAAAVLSATGSADSQLVSASNQYTSDINAVGGQLKRSSAINTADNMTPEEIRSSVLSQIVGISQTASADALIKGAVGSALPQVNANSGKMSAGSAIDASKLDPSVIASMVAQQSTMVSATASGDTAILNVRQQNQGSIKAAGGQLVAGSHVNTADNMTVDQIQSMVASQIANISATGKVDGSVAVALSDASQAAKALGVDLLSGKNIDVSSMTPDQIQQLGQSLVSNLSMVAQHDQMIQSAVPAVSGVVSAAGGQMAPGSVIDATDWTPDQIASEEAQQSAMISATGSADADVQSHANSANDDITAVGGTIKQSGTVNTADNMTVSEVASDVVKQDARISQTASADRQIGKVVSDNASAISGANGVEKPGSAIDTTNLTPEQVDSMVKHQEAMVSATGSADADVYSHANSASADITGVGGTIKQSGTVNTADNMTVSDVASDVVKQDARISQTASADRQIGKVVSDNASAISGANGVEKPGSAIDTTNLTPEQVDSMVKYQEAMVSATGSADLDVYSHANSASGDIIAVGGTIKQSGTVNTADNMTVSEVASDVAKQDARISQTDSADRQIGKVVSNNASAISDANGVEKPGKAIDTTNLTSEQVDSMVKHQEAMVSATGSADADVQSHANSASFDITAVGGTIKQSGTVNTADNMTVSEVASDVVKQDARISQTASADRQIGKVVSDNASAISGANGVEKPGSAIDTTNLTPEQVDSMVRHQEEMVSATGSADADVQSHANSVSADITAVGGTIKQSGTVNTANNMTVSDVASDVAKQDARISQTASADRQIGKVVSDNASAISGVNGVEKPGKAIDTTNLTPEQVDSMVKHQEAMVSATGSADAQLKRDVDSATGDITKVGGTISQSGTVNTADNMTVSEVASDVAKQSVRISQTASADRQIGKVVSDNASAISGVNGVEKPGKAIDTTNMTSEQVDSMVKHQEAMVSATGSADAQIKRDVDSATGDITRVGGTIKQSGTVNTADNMTVSEVASDVAKQSARISETASADRGIEQVLSTSSAAISAIGGITKPGKEIDTTDLTSNVIASMVAHQEAMVSATASADTVLKSMVDGISDAVKSNAGFVKSGGSVNTANNMTVDQIKSAVDVQLGRLSAVNLVDQSLADMIKNGSGTIFGGKVKPGSAIDVSDKTGSQIMAMGQSQAALVSQVISNNVMLSKAEASAASIVAKVGGKVSKGSPIDVTGKTFAEIVSLAKAQAAVLDAVADVDDQLNVALQNKHAITKVGGTVTRGADINAVSMSPDAIREAGKKQVANLSATASGDAMIQNAVNDVWSETATRGSATDVSQMTPDQIASLTASEVDALGETQNANEQLSQAVKQTSESIHRIGGKTIAVPTRDTTKLSSDEIGSSAASQTGKLAETATADDLVSTAVSQHNGIVMSSVAAVNTTKMASQEIVSEVHSQTNHISHTDLMQSTVSNQIAAQLNKVTTAGGHIAKSGIFDTTSMTEDAMTSWTRSENAHLEHVGSNDAVLTSTINVQHNGLAILGGSAVSQAAIDVTSMTDAEIDSLMQSQATLISQAASANLQMKSMYDSAKAEGTIMTSNQTSLSNKAAIDSLLTSTTRALSSAVTVARTSKMVSSAVDSFNTAMNAVVAQYKQAGGNPLDIRMVTINPGVDAATVSATASSALASLSTENSMVESQMSVATETMNYITNNVSDMIKSLGSEATATSGIQFTSAGSLHRVHNLSELKTDWSAQKNSVSATIAKRKHANDNEARVSAAISVADAKVEALANQAKAIGVRVTKDSPVGNGSYNQFVDTDVSSMIAKVSTADDDQMTAISNVIALQKKYNQQYSEASQSAQTKYDNEYSSYVTKSNSIATSYGSAINSYDKASTAVSQANKDVDDSYATAMASYNAEIGKLTSEQHKTGSWNGWGNGGYLNCNVSYDITWHYDPSSDSVIVDNVKAQVSSGSHYTTRFIDVLMLTKPNMSLPGPEPGFTMHFSGTLVDVPGTTAQSVYNRYANDIIAYVATTGDNRGTLWTHSNNLGNYTAKDLGNHKYELATAFDRARGVKPQGSPDPWGDAVEGHTDYPIWLEMPEIITVQLPIKPSPGSHQTTPTPPTSDHVDPPVKDTVTKKYASVSYHSNTANKNPSFTQVSLYGYKDDDRFAPVMARSEAPRPEMTVTSADPIYKALSTKVPDVKTNYHAYDTNLIDHFSYQYSPLSTQYHVYNDEGGYNPEDFNYSPVGSTYDRYDTDGTNIPPMIEDPKNPGHLIPNPKFTGYTPWSTTWKNYSTDGTNIPPMIEDPKNPGHLIPNPKFTGYTPWSTTWKNYSTDGTNIPPMIPDPKNPGHLIPNPKFSGYTPWSTTWKNYSTDGTNIPPMIEDPKNPGHLIPNPKFSGYTPWSTTWKNYSTDGTNIPPMIEDPKNPGHLIPNPKFSGYTPWSTTWKNYSTDGTNIPPMIEDPKNPGHLIPNPKFSGYTPWSTTWKNYSTDGTNIPPMIEDPKNPGHLIPNPKFSGYTPWSTTWKNYSSDGRAISKTVPPVIPDPNNPGKFIKNPKFTGYAPMTAQKRALDTKYVVFDSDGSQIPPVIPDPDHPGKLIPNPKFTGYAPFSYTYSPYSDDGTKVPSMIPDGHGGLMPNPRFTGYAPLSTTYTPLSTIYHNYVAAPEKAPVMPQPAKPAPAPAPAVATVVTSAPLEPEPAQPAPALPQTGYQDNSYLALIGLATLASVSALSLIGLRKKNELD